MKDSGIPWIGMIPEDWKVCRHKDIFSSSKELVGSKWNSTQLLSLTTKGIKSINPSEQTGKVPDSYETYQIVEPNNIVMCLFDLDCSAVFAGISPIKGMISPAYKVLTTFQSTHPKYIDYYFQFIFNGRKFMYLSKNIRYSLTYDEFAMIHISIPSFYEQEKIASWLDEKCGEIDELIEVEQKMIVELEAYRQALITETVTRGLNPEAPMRQTGISWLPEIPEHWETITLRGLSKKFRKGSGITKEDLMENGDILCIRYGDLYTKYDFHMSNIQCRTNVDKIASPVYGEYGDILFTCSGEDIDAIGKSAALLCSEPCLIGGDLIIMKHDQYPKFLGYSISSEIAQKQKSYGKSKLKVVHTSVKDLKNVIIALPPIEEQQAIADYLDTKCKEIDELIAVKREKIDTLKQYRQSIIFEAVTGKLNI